MYSEFQNYLFDAVESALTWDVPEDSFAQAVHAQACLMAGINKDEVIGYYAS